MDKVNTVAVNVNRFLEINSAGVKLAKVIVEVLYCFSLLLERAAATVNAERE